MTHLHEYSIMSPDLSGIIDSVTAANKDEALELFRARWDDADGPIPAHVRIIREN